MKYSAVCVKTDGVSYLALEIKNETINTFSSLFAHLIFRTSGKSCKLEK